VAVLGPAMPYRLVYGAVHQSQRRAIYVVRVHGEPLEPLEIADIDERMRERLASRGELAADVVVVQGDHQHTLRFHGASYSVSVVREAMFNAAVSWTPLDLY
jgi:hypothetical protein